MKPNMKLFDFNYNEYQIIECESEAIAKRLSDSYKNFDNFMFKIF